MAKLKNSTAGGHNIPCICYKNCAAKTTADGRPGLSVQEHCEHVGEVASALIRRLPEAVRRLIPDGAASLVALHDIGKVSPGFQKKYFPEHLKSLSPDLARLNIGGFETNHAEISAASLESWLKKQGKSNLKDWCVVLGQHHGDYRQPLLDGVDVYGGVSWQKERHKLIKALLERFGPLPDSGPSSPQKHIISGLVCVADWIASDEYFFPPEGFIEKVDLRERAEFALDECGWVFPHIKQGLSFGDIFKVEPYPIQSALMKAASKPGLYVLEAPMGQGKTEAALYAVYKLMAADLNSGFYFGLPTRLTSERIHERVNAFLDAVVEEKSRARLIHSQAWLREFQRGGQEFKAGGAWFNPRKRALLLPFGVGTVDQALLSVLRVKHYFLRSLGLAGKVVILDEVHSYDVYTGTLLDELIKSLLAMGCSVIVLSATLTKERRAGFFPVRDIPGTEAYPLITYQEQEDRVKAVSVSPPPSRRVRVKFEFCDESQMAAQAVECAGQGQCVLWITNTVRASQAFYKGVKNEMAEDQFQVGLLHSRFPAFRRERLESEWMVKLGKNGRRPQGCVLVATQVVEQSVDIDADFLITDLAPTDMLLQRMGRLWRHERDDRPCKEPEVLIVSGDVANAQDTTTLKEALGHSARVYNPYVLWRSFQVWSSKKEILLPAEIRELLEATYQEPGSDEPDFIQEARGKLEKRKNELHDLALGGMAEAMPTMIDDEQAATRYSTQKQVPVLLVRDVDSREVEANLVLADGREVFVAQDRRDFSTTITLHRNLVPVARYFLGKIKKPRYLHPYLYGDVAVLRVEDDGRLVNLEDQVVPLGYDDEKGVYQVEGAAFRQEEEYYESDW